MMENIVLDQAGCFENTPLLPQGVKSGSIPGFAHTKWGLSLFLERGCPHFVYHARSAFHTVFSITQPDPIHIKDLQMVNVKKG